MTLNDKTTQRINSILEEKRLKNNKHKSHLNIELYTFIDTKISKDNTCIAKLEELTTLIDELTILKETIEEEIGLML